MNKRILSIVLFAFSALVLATPNVQAQYIPDTYIGDVTLQVGLNNDPNNLDVYDPINQKYDVSGMNVNVVNNQLTVTLYGDYFSTWGTSPLSAEIYAPGSLFLSVNGWNPAGTSSDGYMADNMYTGTTWDYAITLTGLGNGDMPATSGSTSLYDTGSGEIKPGMKRINQEAWFVPTEGENALATGDWELGATWLTITINLSETDWDGISDIGLHWTMGCGNDVIEGAYHHSPGGSTPVPEPATILLFGCGLLGLAGVARRRVR